MKGTRGRGREALAARGPRKVPQVHNRQEPPPQREAPRHGHNDRESKSTGAAGVSQAAPGVGTGMVESCLPS